MLFKRLLIILIGRWYRFNYSFFNFYIPNLSSVFSNRIIFLTIPDCQQKVYITGKGIVTIGSGCAFGYKLGGFNRHGCVELQARYKSAVILIKDNVHTNNNVFLCAANHIEIGKGTLIGQHVTMMDFEAHGNEPDQRDQVGEIGKIVIGENVWIGNNVTILKNTEIGNNTIVAAGAVVSGRFPENMIIGGVPAKVIKRINE